MFNNRQVNHLGRNTFVLSCFATIAAFAQGTTGTIKDTVVGWGSQTFVGADQLRDVVAVAAGNEHSLALKADGSIVAWGDSAYGKCLPPPSNTGFIKISAASSHNLGLKSDGSIVAWGRNDLGQCNVPAPNTNFVDVVGGGWHSIGLRADGSLVAWGCYPNGGDFGQCYVAPPNADFVSVAAGRRHTLALKVDGSLIASGCLGAPQYDYGQCNEPSPNTNFVRIAAGIDHNLGLKSDGSIVAWGRNDQFQCKVPLPNTGFVDVAAGANFSIGLKSNGQIQVWGQMASGLDQPPDVPDGVMAMSAGAAHGLILSKSGKLYMWGDNGLGQCNVPQPNQDVVKISIADDGFALALRADGSLVCWGALGRCENMPVPNEGFVSVVAGGNYNLALKANGKIIAWGANCELQCGVIENTEPFVAVSLGWGHVLGLLSNGTIVSWGNNDGGQLDVPALFNASFVAVAAGSDYSMGLTSNRQIACWGRNFHNECYMDQEPNTEFVGISAGFNHSLGVKAYGRLVVMGDSAYGAQEVPTHENFAQASAGSFRSAGVLWDGSVVAWPPNDDETGVGGETGVPLPNTNYGQVAAGYGQRSLAIRGDLWRAPWPHPQATAKSRFLSIWQPSSVYCGIRVKLKSLHHVDPPYSGGPSTPFTEFEGQYRWVGPPTMYRESTSSSDRIVVASLQCQPHFQDWSTANLFHVTGSEIVPSSEYEIQTVAPFCVGSEDNCAGVSEPMIVRTGRWGDVETPYNPPSTTAQPDVGDMAALVSKFQSAPGAPIKARALLAGDDAFGNISPSTLSLDLGFSHIAACVDAFRGKPYPHTIQACP